MSEQNRSFVALPFSKDWTPSQKQVSKDFIDTCISDKKVTIAFTNKYCNPTIKNLWLLELDKHSQSLFDQFIKDMSEETPKIDKTLEEKYSELEAIEPSKRTAAQKREWTKVTNELVTTLMLNK